MFEGRAKDRAASGRDDGGWCCRGERREGLKGFKEFKDVMYFKA
jgi:hypothetical protein